MPELFLGAEVRAGNFTDEKTGKNINYNNLLMTFGKPAAVGFVISNPKKPVVKVKNTREDILRIFGEMITMKWLNDRRNWYADVFYDDKNNVSRIMFYGPDDPYADNSGTAPALTADEGISDYDHGGASASPLGELEKQLASAPGEMPDDKKGGKK